MVFVSRAYAFLLRVCLRQACSLLVREFSYEFSVFTSTVAPAFNCLSGYPGRPQINQHAHSYTHDQATERAGKMGARVKGGG